jgi:CBS domain-containing protein
VTRRGAGKPSAWLVERYGWGMQLREIMTSAVVTADLDADILAVAQLMRDHGVGSVVLCDPEGGPAAIVTDRDLSIRVLAEERPLGEAVRGHVSKPLVSGDPGMDLEEAAALMVQHRIRRLPVVEDGELIGIATLDDIAVRTGNLDVAQRMTQEVIEGALPEFFFHDRG